MTEAEIQREILSTLGSRPDVRLWRANAGRALIPTASGGLRPIQVNLPGCPDLIGWQCVPVERLTGCVAVWLGIECKSSAGRMRPDQTAFGAALVRHGGLYVVARSVSDATEGLIS